jgi:uncharacterized membrane protein
VNLFWLICAFLAALMAASVWFAFQSPDFVVGLTVFAIAAAVRASIPQITKRMKPDQEKAFRDCVRRGGEWDHIRKKCK